MSDYRQAVNRNGADDILFNQPSPPYNNEHIEDASFVYEPTNSPSLLRTLQSNNISTPVSSPSLTIPDSQNSSSSSSSPLCSPQNVRFSPNITHTPYHTNQSIPCFNSSQPRQTSSFVNSSTANFSPIHFQQTPPLRPNYQA